MKTIQVKINGEWITTTDHFFEIDDEKVVFADHIEDIRLLNDSECEHEYGCEFTEPGLMCNCRPDRIKKNKLIKDLERWKFPGVIGGSRGDFVPWHAVVDALENPGLFESGEPKPPKIEKLGKADFADYPDEKEWYRDMFVINSKINEIIEYITHKNKHI